MLENAPQTTPVVVLEEEPSGGIPNAPWLEHLVAQLAQVRSGMNADSVHQLRVAVARLRVWLALGGRRALRDDLKWLRDRAAALRDLDVQLASNPPPAWASELLKRRERARKRMLASLESPRLRGLLIALASSPPVPQVRARIEARRIVHKVLRRARRTEDPHGIHRLRCAVRRLRFALEWLGTPMAAFERLQDVLGAVSDALAAERALQQTRRPDRAVRQRLRKVRRDLTRHSRAAREVWKQVEPLVLEMR